ncbi:MAG: LysR family transcriptional regulator [Sphingorhabdus sp.]
MRLPDFEAWSIFATVAAEGGFSRAADLLGLSKATVSKAISRLEAHVGAPLFHRTSRRLVLSESGAALLEQAKAIVAAGEAAEEAARDEASEPVGQIRLAAPMSYGISRVAPLLSEFLCSHRGINIDMHLSDAKVDLIGERFDLALRIGALPDSSLRARRLRGVKSYVIASPSYLEANGEPHHPAQLGEHRCISYSLSSTPEIWRFTGPDGSEAVVRLQGPLRVNNGEAMLPALCAGLGIGTLPDFICEKEIATGRLKPILTDWKAPPIAIHIVTPPSSFRPRRVTALIEFLAEKLSAA